MRSPFACYAEPQPQNCAQGFGKAKNRVGMRRPAKRKVEKVETTAEADAEAENDTGLTGAQHLGVDNPDAAAVGKDPTVGPGHKRWKAAFAAWEEAEKKAMLLRAIATEENKRNKLAQRIYDAKMMRLDAGDKLKRRKNPFGAAIRSYEAVIELMQAEQKCVWYQCRAAEAERDAVRAEMRVMELE